MALTVVGCTGAHGDAAVGPDLDRGELGGRARRRDLYVAGDSDPQQEPVSLRAALFLLRAQLVVAGHLDSLVQSRCVVTRVISGVGRGRVRKFFASEQVPAPQLDRVQVELGCQQVHPALDQRSRLGPAGAPVGGRGRGVGREGPGLKVDSRDPIAARGHLAGQQRQEGALGGVGASVGQDPRPEADQDPVAAGAQFQVLDLAAALAHGQHPL